MRSVWILVCIIFWAPAQAQNTSTAEFICSDVTDTLERKRCVDKAIEFTRGSAANEATPATSGWVSFSILSWIVYYGFGVIVGSFVYRDCGKREWLFLGIRPLWWAGLVVFNPALGVLAYWAVHYSRLAQTYLEATTPSDTQSAG